MFQTLTLLLFAQNILLNMNPNVVIIFQNKSEKVFCDTYIPTKSMVDEIQSEMLEKNCFHIGYKVLNNKTPLQF